MKTITLTNGQETLVDDEDFERCNQYTWSLSFNGEKSSCSVLSKVDGKLTRLHHFITGWRYVDHRNGNPLDNRKDNLRNATHQQNMYNRKSWKVASSKYKGVVKRPDGKYEVNIKHEGHSYYLGRFLDEKFAALVYNNKAKELFGEFAKLNNIYEQEK